MTTEIVHRRDWELDSAESYYNLIKTITRSLYEKVNIVPISSIVEREAANFLRIREHTTPTIDFETPQHMKPRNREKPSIFY